MNIITKKTNAAMHTSQPTLEHSVAQQRSRGVEKISLGPGPFIAMMEVMIMFASPNRVELSFLVSVTRPSRRTVGPGRSQIEHGYESS